MNLREAAQQALEALQCSEPARGYACTCQGSKHWPNCRWQRHQAAIAALRAALALEREQSRAWYTIDEINAKFDPPKRQPLTDEEMRLCAYVLKRWTQSRWQKAGPNSSNLPALLNGRMGLEATNDRPRTTGAGCEGGAD